MTKCPGPFAIKGKNMFARRHPFLFFSMMMTACFTIMFVAVIFMVSVTTAMIGSRVSMQNLNREGNIGIVEINGVILSSKKIIQEIKDFRDDPGIKAIIVRINSPGGGIGPSQEIYREIEKTRPQKKIITSMGSVAASGGYYIASATEGIIANPGTITGSIGVIMEYTNLMEIAKKIGISPVVIKSGKFKDAGSPLRELDDAERRYFQDLVDELHQQFVKDAAKARKIPLEKMAALADGRVFTGQKALGLKLIDRIGNLDDAITWAGELAGIKGKLKPVYPPEDKMTFIKRLTETLLKDLNISGAVSDNLRYIIN